MADDLAARILKLEQRAIDAGVRDQVGDMPGNPEMYGAALADAIGIDSALALDPDIDLDLIERITGATS